MALVLRMRIKRSDRRKVTKKRERENHLSFVLWGGDFSPHQLVPATTKAISVTTSSEKKGLLWSSAQSHPESPGEKPAFASVAVAEAEQPTPNAKQTSNS